MLRGRPTSLVVRSLLVLLLAGCVSSNEQQLVDDVKSDTQALTSAMDAYLAEPVADDPEAIAEFAADRIGTLRATYERWSLTVDRYLDTADLSKAQEDALLRLRAASDEWISVQEELVAAMAICQTRGRTCLERALDRLESRLTEAGLELFRSRSAAEATIGE